MYLSTCDSYDHLWPFTSIIAFLQTIHILTKNRELLSANPSHWIIDIGYQRECAMSPTAAVKGGFKPIIYMT